MTTTLTEHSRTASPGSLGIELTGIERRFASASALAGVDLHIPEGSFTVIVGPSGCGKSTLLRILAGLDAPTAGRLRMGGQDVTDHGPGRRDVAMVFQDYALYPHMTVERNISFGLRLQRKHDRRNGPTTARISAEVHRVAALLGLEQLLQRKPAHLSGGQRQRVAVARAIIRRPGVLLLDEPLSALDVALRASARAELLRLHREIGATLVLVTHDQREALSMATELVVMHAGRVVQTGPPEQVYRRPASEFIARFVGSPAMNLRPTADGSIGWRASDARIIPQPRGGTASSDLVVSGVVEVTEYAGDGQEIVCRNGDEVFTLVQREGDRWLSPGEPVTAIVPARSLHRFGADGRRIDD
jgi:multiple sugar transport system ATP-binding protein